MNIRLLPLLIGAVLCAGGASAAPTGAKAPAAATAAAAPTAQQLANRAEIERLTARIRELSKDLGEGTQVRVITRTGKGDGDHPSWHSDGDKGGERRIERFKMGAGPGTGRPGLGIVMAPNPAAAGVRIAAVTPDSPAAKAGLRSGDVMLSVNGKKIAGNDTAAIENARTLLGDLKQDQVVKLGYAREGKTYDATMKADAISRMMVFNRSGGDGPMRMRSPGAGHMMMLPPEVEMDIERMGPKRECAPGNKDCHFPAMVQAFRWQGLNLSSIDTSLGRYFGTDKGVLVVSSNDDLKGLQSGDVIQRVAGKEVATPREVMRALFDKKEGEQLKVDVLRDRKASTVTLTVPKARALPFMTPPPAPPAPPAVPRAPNVAPPALPAAPTPPPKADAMSWVGGSDGDVHVFTQEIVEVRADAGDDEDQEMEIIVLPAR